MQPWLVTPRALGEKRGQHQRITLSRYRRLHRELSKQYRLRQEVNEKKKYDKLRKKSEDRVSSTNQIRLYSKNLDRGLCTRGISSLVPLRQRENVSKKKTGKDKHNREQLR